MKENTTTNTSVFNESSFENAMVISVGYPKPLVKPNSKPNQKRFKNKQKN